MSGSYPRLPVRGDHSILSDRGTPQPPVTPKGLNSRTIPSSGAYSGTSSKESSSTRRKESPEPFTTRGSSPQAFIKDGDTKRSAPSPRSSSSSKRVSPSPTTEYPSDISQKHRSHRSHEIDTGSYYSSASGHDSQPITPKQRRSSAHKHSSSETQHRASSDKNTQTLQETGVQTDLDQQEDMFMPLLSEPAPSSAPDSPPHFYDPSASSRSQQRYARPRSKSLEQQQFVKFMETLSSMSLSQSTVAAATSAVGGRKTPSSTTTPIPFIPMPTAPQPVQPIESLEQKVFAKMKAVLPGIIQEVYAESQRAATPTAPPPQPPPSMMQPPPSHAYAPQPTGLAGYPQQPAPQTSSSGRNNSNPEAMQLMDILWQNFLTSPHAAAIFESMNPTTSPTPGEMYIVGSPSMSGNYAAMGMSKIPVHPSQVPYSQQQQMYQQHQQQQQQKAAAAAAAMRYSTAATRQTPDLFNPTSSTGQMPTQQFIDPSTGITYSLPSTPQHRGGHLRTPLEEEDEMVAYSPLSHIRSPTDMAEMRAPAPDAILMMKGGRSASSDFRSPPKVDDIHIASPSRQLQTPSSPVAEALPYFPAIHAMLQSYLVNSLAGYYLPRPQQPRPEPAAPPPQPPPETEYKPVVNGCQDKLGHMLREGNIGSPDPSTRVPNLASPRSAFSEPRSRTSSNPSTPSSSTNSTPRDIPVRGPTKERHHLQQRLSTKNF